MSTASDTKSKIKSKIGKKNIISTALAEPFLGVQNPDEDVLPDEPLVGDDNQVTGTLTSQVPDRTVPTFVPNKSESNSVTPVIAPPTGGRKVSANGDLQLAYIVYNNQLYSLRPDEFDALDYNDINASMIGRRTLKHNPTNVFGKGELLRSTEDRRPLFFVKEGKLVRMDTIETPTKAESVKADKSVKTLKGNGPNIIYIDDRRYVEQNGGSHLYSINAAQFSDVMSGKIKLNGHKILIHLPTCVTRDKDGFLHSSQPERRPMYRFQLANAEADIAEDGIVAVDVAEVSALDQREVLSKDDDISEIVVQSPTQTLEADNQDLNS